jgi:hypothetical protein
VDLTTLDEQQNWYALLAATIAAFLIATGVGFLLDIEDSGGSRPTDRVAHESRFTPDDPSIPQAPWRISTHASASLGKVTKKQRRALRGMAPKVEAAVRDIYDAMILSRTHLVEAAQQWMTPLAARELKASPPIPDVLKRVRTMRRGADIGIDVRTRRRAAAKVGVIFRAERGKQRMSFAHRGTLWLERMDGKWQVIAFDIDQRRRA